MHYPSRVEKQRIAKENFEDEVVGGSLNDLENETKSDNDVADITTAVAIQDPEDDVNQLAELVRNDNETQADAKDIGELLKQTSSDVATLDQIKAVATEALKNGGMDFNNAMLLSKAVNHIANRYYIKPKQIGLENFLYEDTKIVATEDLVDKAADLITKLVGSIAKAAEHLADLLTTTIKRLIKRASSVKKEIAEFRAKVNQVANFISNKVPLLDSVSKLRVNGRVDLQACIDLADKEKKVEAIAEQWKGLWARRGSKGAIYSEEFQTDSSGFIKPMVSEASTQAIKALPKKLSETTPVNVYALPGDIYVSTIKDNKGIISTGWSESIIPIETNEYLPAIESKEDALEILDAAWSIADFIDTKLPKFISASDSIEAAAQELARVKQDFEPTKEQIAQAKANLDAAYALENALLRSLWNVTEGLFMYAKKSVEL